MQYKLTNFCEIDKFASESYSRIHNEPLEKNLGDISLVDTDKIEDFDLLVGGSPCFVAGTKILTENGYKNIESIEVGDKVLTHKNRYMPVIRIGGRENQEIYELNTQGFLSIQCTKEHPFYCRKTKESNPEKIRLEDLKSGYYLGSHIISNETLSSFVSNTTFEDLTAFFDYYKYSVGTILTMKKEYLLQLALMCQKIYNIGCNMHCDIDEKLYSLTYNDNNDWFIENNIVWYPIKEIKKTNTIQNVYNIEVEEDHTYTANNIITYNCQDLSLAGKKNGAVYTCKDCGHKYNPLEAHFSKRDKCPICGSTNLEKTRSSLIVEYLRFLREKQPMFAIYENVKNIVGKEFKEMFDLFIEEVKEIGYVPYWEVMNAKYYGIPQNRERVIGVFIRKDINHGFTYPEKFDVLYSINNILQKNVPQNYYISLDKSEPLVRELILRNKLAENQEYIWNKNQIHNLGLLNIKGTEQCRRVYGKDGLAPTINTCQGGNHQVKILEDSHRAFNMNPSKHGISGCVYQIDGVSPTLMTSELKILYPISNCVASEYRTDMHYLTYRDNVCGTLRTINSCGCKRIIEPIDLPICVASRGRNIENPNSRMIGAPTTQRLEPNPFTFNTLTTVQKDNYVLETINSKMEEFFKNTLFPMHFEYQEVVPLTEEKDDFFFNELKNYFYKTNNFPQNYNLLTHKEFIFGENDKYLLTLSKKQLDILMKVFGETGYRVRKITPREAFRLMGFNDESFEKARYYTDEERKELDRLLRKYRTEYDLKGKERAIKLSDAQAYKEAGNSIVVNVLYYVFKELYNQYDEFSNGIKLCSLFSGIGAFEQGLAAVNNEKILLQLK